MLAPFQPAISKLLEGASIPGVAIVGADLPGSPSVGADNDGASVLDGRYLAAVSKQRYPDAVPYAVVAAEPSAGAIVMQRYYGAVAGIKQIYKSLPPDHIIQVKSDGTEAGTYNNAVSALSQIPSDGVVLMTAVNDEVTHGLYKAAGARHLKNYLVNSFGGDPFGSASRSARIARTTWARSTCQPGEPGARRPSRSSWRRSTEPLVPEGSRASRAKQVNGRVARDRLQVRAELGLSGHVLHTAGGRDAVASTPVLLPARSRPTHRTTDRTLEGDRVDV